MVLWFKQRRGKSGVPVLSVPEADSVNVDKSFHLCLPQFPQL